MLYQLMNKDKVVATYEEEKRLDDYRYTEIERLDGYVPYGFVDINDWIDGRQIAKHRTSIERPCANWALPRVTTLSPWRVALRSPIPFG